MMAQRFGRLFVGFAAYAMLWHCVGCAGMPKTFDQALVAVQKAADIAREQGVAYVASASWDGTVRGTLGYTAVLNSGVEAEVVLFGNAARGESVTAEAPRHGEEKEGATAGGVATVEDEDDPPGGGG